MKKLTLLFFLYSGLCFSQGLNYEIGINKNYTQSLTDLKTDSLYSYNSYNYRAAASFVTSSFINKVDTNGAISWTHHVYPLPSEVTETKKIELTQSDIFACGKLTPTCDVGGMYLNFIQKISKSGVVDWSFTSRNDTYNYQYSLSIIEEQDIYFGVDNNDSTLIYRLDATTGIQDSLTINQKKILHYSKLTPYELLTITEDSITAYNNSFDAVNSIVLNNIKDIHSLNDTLFVLTTNELILLDQNLNVIGNNTYAGYQNFKTFKVDSLKIEVLNVDNSTISKLTTNHNLQLITNQDITAYNAQAYNKIDFEDSHVSLGKNFSLTNFNSIRLQDYSFESSQSYLTPTSDLTILDTRSTNVNLHINSTNNFSFSFEVEAQVKNQGANVVNSLKLNLYHQYFMGICNPDVYNQEFTNLNLQPNESRWIPLGHTFSLNGVSFSSTIHMNICVYTSHPNRVVDTIVSNDSYCEDFIFGHVGLKDITESKVEIYPNPASEHIIVESDFEALDYNIYNSVGQVVQHGEINSNKINVGQLNAGLYILELKNGDQKFTKKLLIE